MNGPEKLLKVIKVSLLLLADGVFGLIDVQNPVVDHLPVNTYKIGLRMSFLFLVDVNFEVTQLSPGMHQP